MSSSKPVPKFIPKATTVKPNRPASLRRADAARQKAYDQERAHMTAIAPVRWLIDDVEVYADQIVGLRKADRKLSFQVVPHEGNATDLMIKWPTTSKDRLSHSLRSFTITQARRIVSALIHFNPEHKDLLKGMSEAIFASMKPKTATIKPNERKVVKIIPGIKKPSVPKHPDEDDNRDGGGMPASNPRKESSDPSLVLYESEFSDMADAVFARLCTEKSSGVSRYRFVTFFYAPTGWRTERAAAPYLNAVPLEVVEVTKRYVALSHPDLDVAILYERATHVPHVSFTGTMMRVQAGDPDYKVFASWEGANPRKEQVILLINDGGDGPTSERTTPWIYAQPKKSVSFQLS
jgi:hypothetical protein